jgi:DNA-binding transcriptional MerR regulator
VGKGMVNSPDYYGFEASRKLNQDFCFIFSHKTLDLESTPSDKLSIRGEPMKIAEVSEHYGISSDTLRYYERIGLIPPVNRNGNGIRDYNSMDMKRVEFIKCMRSAGLPIETLIEYVGLVQQGDTTIAARREILKDQRELLVARMKEMQQTLDLLDYKISVYENAILKKEKEIIQLQE